MLTQKFTAFCSVCNQGTHIWVPQCTKECEIECHRPKFESPVEPKMKIWVLSWTKGLNFESQVEIKNSNLSHQFNQGLKFESPLEPNNSNLSPTLNQRTQLLSPQLNQRTQIWVLHWTKDSVVESPVEPKNSNLSPQLIKSQSLLKVTVYLETFG